LPPYGRYHPLMKQTFQTRVLLLSCCLLILVRSSEAQGGLGAPMNGGSQATTPITQAAPKALQREPITLPAGTHLLMKLISPVHTTSSTPGSGVYLETVFPVVQNDRVVIPELTRVIGTVADEKRPGRVQGRAQMRLHFTQLILPDNQVLPIAADLQSLPGSSRNRTVDREGTLEPVDQIDADVYTVAKTTGAGILVGSISHVGIGVGHGALIGAGLGLAKVLFTRGNEISLPVGTRVEMVLQHELTVQPVFPELVSPFMPADSVATTSATPAASNGRNLHGPADHMPCLRDGVSLQCVVARILIPSQRRPVAATTEQP
jgi:hypothetical protein